MSTLTLASNSRNHWLADGTQTIWNFTFAGGYIRREHVRAYHESPGGVITDLPIADTDFIGDFQVRILPAVPAGYTFVIFRDSANGGLPLVDFQDGGRITEVSLDTVAKQSVFVATESADFLGVTTSQDLLDLAQAAATSAGAAAASAINSSASATTASTQAAGALNSATSAAASAASAASAVSALAGDLANTTIGSLGAGKVGFNYSLTYVASSIGKWLKDLATTTGASFIGWIAQGTGAILRTVQDKLRDHVNVLDYGAIMNDSASGTRTTNSAAILAAAAINPKVAIPAGVLYIAGDIEVPKNLQLSGQGRLLTTVEGEGDLFKITTSDFGTPVFRDMTIQNGTTRGNLFSTDVGSDIGRVEFHNVEFLKSTHHIYSTDICVAWIIKGCRFNDATSFSRHFTAGLWAHTEVGNYTWFCGGGLFVAGSSHTCHIEGVFEYNTNDGILLSGDTTAGISDWVIACHFEGNGASGASDVTLNTTVAARIRGINFLGSTFILPQAAQTERVSISAGGGGTIGAIGFIAGSCYGTKPLATDVASVYIHPTFWLDAITPLPNQQIPFTPAYQFSGSLGSVTIVGVSGGNGTVQASIIPPAGTKWANVYVQGNSYNGVADSNDGRLYGNYRASGSRTTTDVDVNHSAGTNQGWVLTWTGSAIQVANKSGMTNAQSADTTVVFYG